MLRLFPRLMFAAGIGMAVAACQDGGYGGMPGSYQAAPMGYGNPYYNSGYYGAAPARYGYAQPAQNYNYYNRPRGYGWYNPADGRSYTTVTVTNRGQHGHRDDVVQQRVACGSQYFDGYRNRTARC